MSNRAEDQSGSSGQFVQLDDDQAWLPPPEPEVETTDVRRSKFSCVDVTILEEKDFEDKGKDAPKTPKDVENIAEQIKHVVLFEGYDNEELRLVVSYMYKRLVKPGEVVIRFGDMGDAFYVIGRGQYRCTVPSLDGSQGREIRVYNDSGYFGELALVNRAPRAATVTSLTDGELWVLSAMRCRWLRKQVAVANANRFSQVLQAIPLFRSNLGDSDINRLIDAIEVVVLSPDDVICKQGDPGDAMYFIMEGEIKVIINGQSVGTLVKNEFFGERALILDEPRAATCRAAVRCQLAKLPRDSFQQLIPDSVVAKLKEFMVARYDTKSESSDADLSAGAVLMEYSCKETKE